MTISKEDLSAVIHRVADVAGHLGLPRYPVHFELVDSADMNRLASYGGMPVRYRHWSFGKQWGHYQTAYDYRQTRIYEMVINHDPAYAFVDRTMAVERALVVVAHVLAHVAYFRLHDAFAATRDNEAGVMAGHRRQIEEYQRQVGQDAMEPLLDAGHVLSEFTAESPRERRLGTCHDDLLGYVIQHSPGLCTWQRTVLTMLHQEARYFWPQLLTKIGNEGYATFWHRQIVQQLPLSGDEIVEVARMNAELVQVRPPQLNPYRLGYILVRRAFDEHGQRGLDWVARHLSDVGLVREYLDAETMERAGLRLITAGTVNETEIPPSVLKAQLLADLEHAGLPRLTVENSETARSGILHLTHHHTGRDLDFAMLKMALALVAKELWPTGVVLKTRYRGVEHRLHHDGRQWKEQLPATTALYMERHQVGN